MGTKFRIGPGGDSHAGSARVAARASGPSGFWQSVTGSKDSIEEPLAETCRREVLEETGIDVAAHRLQDWQLTNRYESTRIGAPVS